MLGLDLSLTGTGIARIGNGIELVVTVRPGKATGHERIARILEVIYDAQRGQDLDLVVIEGPSYGSQQRAQQGHHERAGLWWLVAHGLYAVGRPYAVVAPRARAKYATGDGTAGKAVVLQAARERYAHLVAKIGNDNEADALTLAHMGVDYLGGHVVDMPAVNRVALKKVQWPSTPADD